MVYHFKIVGIESLSLDVFEEDFLASAVTESLLMESHETEISNQLMV